LLISQRGEIDIWGRAKGGGEGLGGHLSIMEWDFLLRIGREVSKKLEITNGRLIIESSLNYRTQLS
jgi:hypothetical protein